MIAREPLVLIPAFNEQDSIFDVVRECFSFTSQVVVVDDGSRDATRAQGLDAGAVVLSHEVNMGVCGALLTGFRYAARRDISAVVQIDGDGQHPVSDAARVYSQLCELDFDLVIGSRFCAGSTYEVGAIQSMGMALLRKSTKWRTGISFTDPSSGLRAFSPRLVRELSRAFPDHYLGDTYEVLCAAVRAGFRCSEVGVTMKPRLFGAPSASAFVAGLQVARSVFAVHSGLGYRLDSCSS